MQSEEYERLCFDISFQLGRISKTELKALTGVDQLKIDGARSRIAARIANKLFEGYDLRMIRKNHPPPTTSLKKAAP